VPQGWRDAEAVIAEREKRGHHEPDERSGDVPGPRALEELEKTQGVRKSPGATRIHQVRIRLS
jgi:hypothetical protein